MNGAYDTRPPGAGTLTITKLDRQASLITSRFAFTATNPSTGRQVQVTQGRFDYRDN